MGSVRHAGEARRRTRAESKRRAARGEHQTCNAHARLGQRERACASQPRRQRQRRIYKPNRCCAVPAIASRQPAFATGPVDQRTKLTMANNELKANIGVYTDPQHNLWIDAAEPSVEQAQSGAHLQSGEVVVQIRSTGICGCVTIPRECTRWGVLTDARATAARTCTFGTRGASGL
jgi:hypothetical protein